MPIAMDVMSGAAGTLFWIDRESVIPSKGLPSLVATTTGPLTQAFLQRVDTCAVANCSGHGSVCHATSI